MITFLKSLYLTRRFFYVIAAITLLFLFSFLIPILYPFIWVILVILSIVLVIDIIALYQSKGLSAQRILPEKFSNSDSNVVKIQIKNSYSFKVFTEVIDELPIQFQKRDFLYTTEIKPAQNFEFQYDVTPLQRGEYIFGKLNVYAQSILKLAKIRKVFDAEQMVKVYPSFIQMKKLDFLAIDNRISQAGLKKIRRLGHTMEFEQIKEYVTGDDVRTINWKATAKHRNLMVNQFQDEKAQPVYSVIDTGRVMKMPFEGLSLLDYAINSGLAFSNIALRKKDKTGMISFSSKVEKILKDSSRMSQLQRIMESLYNINTDFKESDFGSLYASINRFITHRSLLMLYTNFEHPSALERQLPYLKAINKRHVLVVIFFENTEITRLLHSQAENLSESAHQGIAEEFSQNKVKMAKELQRNGIQTVLTKPKDLSINTINKYLEIKARGLI